MKGEKKLYAVPVGFGSDGPDNIEIHRRRPKVYVVEKPIWDYVDGVYQQTGETELHYGTRADHVHEFCVDEFSSVTGIRPKLGKVYEITIKEAA